MKTKNIKKIIKKIINRILAFIKSNPIAVASAAAVIIVLTVVLIIAIPSGNGGESNNNWGEGITENIPEIDADFESFTINENSAVAYYEDISTEQVKAYTRLLESELGIRFSSNLYPRSAKWEDKIIVIHYNVTEKRMSLTVTLSENNQ